MNSELAAAITQELSSATDSANPESDDITSPPAVMHSSGSASFVTGGNNNALTSLVGGLSSFSGLLTNALGSIDSSVNHLRDSHNESADLIRALKSQLDMQTAKVGNLESESESQRRQIEHSARNLAILERKLDAHQPGTSIIQRESVSPLPPYKDIKNLRGSIQKSLSETLDIVSNAPKTFIPGTLPTYNPNSTTDESIKFLVDRLGQLEEAMGLQQSFNQQLGTQIGNNDIVQQVYDTLSSQLNALEQELSTAREEAKHAKEEQHRLERQIAQMTGALCNSEKLHEFKVNIERDRRRNSMHHHHHHIHKHQHEHGTVNADADGGGDKEAGEVNVRERRRSHSRSRSRSRSRPFSAVLDKEDELKTEEGSTMPRAHSATRRHRSDENMEDTIPEGRVEDANDEEEDAERKERRRSMRRHRRSSMKHRRRRSTARDSEIDVKDYVDDDDQLHKLDEKIFADADRKYLDTDDFEIEYEEPISARRRSRRSSMRHKERHRRRSTIPGEGDHTESGSNYLADKKDETRSPPLRKQETGRRATAINRSVPVLKRSKTFNSQSIDVLDGTNNEKPAVVVETIRTDADSEAVSVPSTAKPTEAVQTQLIAGPNEAAQEQVDKSSGADPPDAAAYRDDELDTSIHENSEDFYSSMEDSYMDGGSLSSSLDDLPFVSQEVLDKLMEDAKKAQQDLNDMRMKYDEEMGAMQESVEMLKRIAYMVDDLKANTETLRTKVANLSTEEESFEDKKIKSDLKLIALMKEAWLKVRGEMLYGLENLANESESDDGTEHTDDISRQRKEFISKCLELVQELDNRVEDFNPLDTLELTLQRVHPSLDHLYREALMLTRLDDQARKSDELVCTFDDLVCSDLTNNLKNYITTALNASIPVLDISVPKVTMKHRLDELEYVVSHKADSKTVHDLESQVKADIIKKLDAKEFHSMSSRLATAAELQKLHSFVLENMSNMGGSNASVTSPMPVGVDIEAANLMGNPDFRDMYKRFEVLGKQQQEVQSFCDQFVPREEVHEAMRAIIAEVKTLKKGAVTHSIFREGLKMKADTVEMDKLVKTITEAIGDLNFADRVAGQSAAMHVKCLVCDKPVTGINGRGGGMKSRGGLLSASTPLLGYNKKDDIMAEDTHRVPSTFNRLTSPDPVVSAQEKAKIAAELHIVRSSIDPLPDINTAEGMDSPRAAGSMPTQQSQINYKQRIRSSAGGGGGRVKKDTR